MWLRTAAPALVGAASCNGSRQGRSHTMHNGDEQHALEGQGLVEYSLILLLIAIATVASVRALGPALIGAYNVAVNAFP